MKKLSKEKKLTKIMNGTAIADKILQDRDMKNPENKEWRGSNKIGILYTVSTTERKGSKIWEEKTFRKVKEKALK